MNHTKLYTPRSYHTPEKRHLSIYEKTSNTSRKTSKGQGLYRPQHSRLSQIKTKGKKKLPHAVPWDIWRPGSADPQVKHHQQHDHLIAYSYAQVHIVRVPKGRPLVVIIPLRTAGLQGPRDPLPAEEAHQAMAHHFSFFLICLVSNFQKKTPTTLASNNVLKLTRYQIFHCLLQTNVPLSSCPAVVLGSRTASQRPSVARRLRPCPRSHSLLPSRPPPLYSPVSMAPSVRERASVAPQPRSAGSIWGHQESRIPVRTFIQAFILEESIWLARQISAHFCFFAGFWILEARRPIDSCPVHYFVVQVCLDTAAVCTGILFSVLVLYIHQYVMHLTWVHRYYCLMSWLSSNAVLCPDSHPTLSWVLDGV